MHKSSYIWLVGVMWVIASLAVPAQPPSSSANSRLDAILSRGTLRFGIPGDYPPFGKLDKTSGQWTGIDVDEASAMAKALGVRLEIVKTSWPALLKDLQAGEFDVAGGGISITMERQKEAFFSTPILRDGKTPITRCENVDRFASLADIDKQGVRVITPPGGTNESFDRSHLARATILVNSDNQGIFEELVNGRADVMITDGVETRWQHELHPELCSVHPDHPFTVAEKAYMMPRDIPLQQWVNAFLLRQQNSGELNALLAHWLH